MPKVKKEIIDIKADEPDQPTKLTKEAEASSLKIESEVLSANFEIVDPEWAKTSVVDPTTGIHLSQWRQNAVRQEALRNAPK